MHKFFLADGNKDQAFIDLVTNPNVLEGAIGTAPSAPPATSAAGMRGQAFRDKFMTGAGLEAERPAGRPVEEFAAFLKADRAAAEELARVVRIQPE